MKHSVGGPGPRQLGMVSAVEIAAAGRQDEARRLRALVGEVPKRAPGKPPAGREAPQSRQVGTGEGRAARNGQEAARTSGLSGREWAVAIGRMAEARPDLSVAQLSRRLVGLVERARWSQAAAATLADLVAAGPLRARSALKPRPKPKAGPEPGRVQESAGGGASLADFTQHGPVLRPPRGGWSARRLWWQDAGADRGRVDRGRADRGVR